MEYKPVVRDGRPAEAVVIHCLDPDFQPAYEKVKSKLLIDKYDPYIRPGASWVLVKDDSAIKEILIAHDLHHFKKAIILDHISCKMFHINDEQLELDEHKKYLSLAADGLKKAIPGIEVDGYVLGWDHILYSTNESV